MLTTYIKPNPAMSDVYSTCMTRIMTYTYNLCVNEKCACVVCTISIQQFALDDCPYQVSRVTVYIHKRPKFYNRVFIVSNEFSTSLFQYINLLAFKFWIQLDMGSHRVN